MSILCTVAVCWNIKQLLLMEISLLEITFYRVNKKSTLAFKERNASACKAAKDCYSSFC